MANLTLTECLQPELVTVERVNYFPRQLLTADDMFADQEYFRLKSRRHNRFMHGWGTVCGLLVSAAPTATQPWLVQISGGYALGPYGDEIFVAEPVFFDLAQCGAAVTDPCEPDVLIGAGGTPSVGATVYVAIQYSECMARPVRVMPSGCGCEQTACENSRIRDSFQVECLSALPSSYQLPPPTISLCDFINSQKLPDCPPCPSDPWVVLAAVTLPVSLGVPVTDFGIDNFSVRRQIFSTAILQQQLIECCCGPMPTPTPPPAQADLAITQAFAVMTDVSGFVGLSLTITVTNNGPSTANNVAVECVLPTLAQVSFITVTPTAPLVLVGGAIPPTMLADVGVVQSGRTLSLQCNFVPNTALSGPFLITSIAAIQSATPDPNPANNTSTVQGTIPVPVQVTGMTPQGPVENEPQPNQVVVTFNKHLRANSVNTSTFLVTDASNNPYKGSVTYDDGNLTATFALPAGSSFPNTFTPTNVTLLGSGPHTPLTPIVDIDFLALDGDGRGKPGVDYKNSFTVEIPK